MKLIIVKNSCCFFYWNRKRKEFFCFFVKCICVLFTFNFYSDLNLNIISNYPVIQFRKHFSKIVWYELYALKLLKFLANNHATYNNAKWGSITELKTNKMTRATIKRQTNVESICSKTNLPVSKVYAQKLHSEIWK